MLRMLRRTPVPSAYDNCEFSLKDLFCGGGGSSFGAEQVPGVRSVMAVNHWDLAVETHNRNMPDAGHDVIDIAIADPSRLPGTDILWASPSCTFFSPARGEKQTFAQPETEPSLFDLLVDDDTTDEPPLPLDAGERSRALMHDVPRFAEYHRYRAVIVENVPALLKWVHFPKWIARMRNLDYDYQVLTLNSAFAHQLGAPAPQLRDRVYVVFWQRRYNRPDFDRWTRPQAWCPTCGEVVTALRAPKNHDRPHGSYGAQYVFRCPHVSCRNDVVQPYVLPAAAIIDWTSPGQRIGDRKRPLAPKTMARIAAGLRRYYGPIALEAAGNTFERRPGVRAWPIEEPLRTLTTTEHRAIAAPPMTLDELRVPHLTEPPSALLIPAEGRAGKVALPADCALRVQAARNETGLLVPAGGTWNNTAQPTHRPLRARTTRDTEGVVVVPLRGTNRAKRVIEPLDTFAASGTHHGLLMRNNSGGAEMSTPTSEPARTITSAGHQSLVWSPEMLYAYETGRIRGTATSPLATQTTVEGDALMAGAAGLDVEDCLFRMLNPGEIKEGMAFPSGYVLLGTKRHQVRMAGNAVTPPVARDLVAAVVEAIRGTPIESPVPTAA